MSNKSPIAFIFAFFICLILALNGNAQTLQLLDDDNGFMMFNFGSNKDSLPELKTMGKWQRMKRYRPANEITSFKGIPLKSVRIHFFQHNIHSVLVKTYGGKNSDKLLDYLEKRYGEGAAENAFKSRIRWIGTEVQCLYEKNLASGDAELYFVHIETNNAYQVFLYKEKYGDY